MSKPRYPAKLFERLKSYPVKHCAYCGAQLTPKLKGNRWGPQLETVAYFEARNTCDRKCGAALRWGKPPPGTAPAAPAAEPDEPRWQPPPAAPVVTLHVADDRPRCEEHGEPVGLYGCTACNVTEGWRSKQREQPLKVRPTP